MTHIPTPWWFRKATQEEKISTAPNEMIIHSPAASWIGNFGSADNTEFMIKAVNAHDDLVAALRRIATNKPYDFIEEHEIAEARRADAEGILKKHGLL